ncbi:hypothetical protein BGZ47_000870, partial [Haplosporangium gracile]
MLPNRGPRTLRSYAAAVAEGSLRTNSKVRPENMMSIDELKGRERRRGPAAAEAITLATKLSTATIQPTTNTPSSKATAQKAPVPAIATRTRAKSANATTPSTKGPTPSTKVPTPSTKVVTPSTKVPTPSIKVATPSTKVPTTTKAPKAPKASSTITKGQKKVLHNNSGTTGSTPLLPRTSKTMKKKRTKAMSKKAVDSADTDDSDPDTVKEPAKKKKVQRYQGPNGSTIRRLPMHQKDQSQAYPTIPPGMTEEEYLQAIKSSSNKVLYDLLARKDCDIQELTVRQHKVKLLTWQFYCDTHYDGDYTVNAERMLPYFENLVFLRTSKKFIVPDIGYDGVIGVRSAGWKPPNPKQRRTAKQTKDIEEWVPESSPMEEGLQVWTPDDADAAIARSEELENNEHEDEHETVAVAMDEVVDVDMAIVISNAREDDNNSVEITTQEELQALHAMVEGEDEAGLVLEAPAEPLIIETEADKMRVFAGLVPDKHGRVAIMVPLSLGTVDNYRKACIYLWKLQNQRTTLCPNPAPNPRSDGPLDDAINAYGVRLVYDKATTGTTRNTACDTRDTYD